MWITLDFWGQWVFFFCFIQVEITINFEQLCNKSKKTSQNIFEELNGDCSYYPLYYYRKSLYIYSDHIRFPLHKLVDLSMNFLQIGTIIIHCKQSGKPILCRNGWIKKLDYIISLFAQLHNFYGIMCIFLFECFVVFALFVTSYFI